MSELFLTVVNMSISASWIVLAVLALRLLFKKAPKWITVALWGIVAVRLVCPFAIESAISLIPSAETINPGIMMDKTPEINGYSCDKQHNKPCNKQLVFTRICGKRKSTPNTDTYFFGCLACRYCGYAYLYGHKLLAHKA